MTFSFLVASVIIISLNIYLSQNIILANHECMVASFYIGLMLACFVTNVIRVMVHYAIAIKVYKNKKSCLRRLVS